MGKRTRNTSFSDDDFTSPKKLIIEHEVTVSKGKNKSTVTQTIASLAQKIAAGPVSALKQSRQKNGHNSVSETSADANSVTSARSTSTATHISSNSTQGTIASVYSKLRFRRKPASNSGQGSSSSSSRVLPIVDRAEISSTKDSDTNILPDAHETFQESSDGFDHFLGNHGHFDSEEPEPSLQKDVIEDTEMKAKEKPKRVCI